MRSISMKRLTLIDISFWFLAIIIFCSLNGLFYAFVGISAAFSPIILLLVGFLMFNIPLKKKWISWPVIFYLSSLWSLMVVGFVSALWNYGNTIFEFSFLSSALREFITSTLIFLVFYFYTYVQYEKGYWKRYLFIIFSIFVFTAMFGVFESNIGMRNSFMYIAETTDRSLGFFGNPNETGLQANFTLVLVLVLFLLKKINPLVTLIFISISVYGAMSSFSKTAIISAIIVIIYFCLYAIFQVKNIKTKYSKRAFSFVAFIMIVIFTLVVPKAINKYDQLTLGQKKRVDATIDIVKKGEISQRTTSNRSVIFIDGLRLIKKRPLIGNGIYTFYMPGSFPSSITHGIHNTYLRLLGEGGIIPFVFFLLFLGSLFYRALYHPIKGIGFLIFSATLVYSFYCMTSHNVFNEMFVVGFMGIITALSTKKKQLCAESPE